MSQFSKGFNTYGLYGRKDDFVFSGYFGMLPLPTLWWALPGWPKNPGYGPDFNPSN